MADREDTLLENRVAKLARIRANGLDPYPARFHRSYDTATATSLFEELEQNDPPHEKLQNVTLAGRITSISRPAPCAASPVTSIAVPTTTMPAISNRMSGFRPE